MRGKLEVCNHKGGGVQFSKELSKITTLDSDKSFHLEFSFNDERFVLNLYCDCFGLAKMVEGKEESIFYFSEDKGVDNEKFKL